MKHYCLMWDAPCLYRARHFSFSKNLSKLHKTKIVIGSHIISWAWIWSLQLTSHKFVARNSIDFRLWLNFRYALDLCVCDHFSITRYTSILLRWTIYGSNSFWMKWARNSKRFLKKGNKKSNNESSKSQKADWFSFSIRLVDLQPFKQISSY